MPNRTKFERRNQWPSIDPTPPHDSHAERKVLGSIFFRPSIIPDVVAVLRPDHFYCFNYRTMYDCAVSLHRKIDPDIPSKEFVYGIGKELVAKRKGLLLEIGGAPFLIELHDETMTSAGWQYYADRVRAAYSLRCLRSLSLELFGESMHGRRSPRDLIEVAKARLAAVEAEAGGGSDCVLSTGNVESEKDVCILRIVS